MTSALCITEKNKFPEDLGTAVNVQSMVFGNMGETSGAGAGFSRNPATGENGIYGEFLINAQGEDIASGFRKTVPIENMEEIFPDAYRTFKHIAEVLEKHYKDMQDMEFTIENNKLYMLQTRPARRTMASAIRVAVDAVEKGLISKKTAIERIDLSKIDQLLHPAFDEKAEKQARILAKGLPASPGAATGRICFSAVECEKAFEAGEKVILVKQDTTPEDLMGMESAEGILTVRGGMTSHAAVVARGMGKCCVCGCTEIAVNEKEKTLTVLNEVFCEGDKISLNGSAGILYGGSIDVVQPKPSDDFSKVLSWADEIRSLKVRANADNPRDALTALAFGAEGIGLCRTEHMFFEEDRIPAIRQMILSGKHESREAYIANLLPYQKEDIRRIYEVMEDKPVTMRLLDLPLQDFLPQSDDEIQMIAEKMNVPAEQLKMTVMDIRERDSMFGHRGCRMMISYPEIARMQTQAIMEAAIETAEAKGIDIVPEIMIPMAGSINEFSEIKKEIIETAENCKKKYGSDMEYLIGAMIEIPRACLTADLIAREADFFSFGTNDLTQMTLGLSRDDTGELIDEYLQKGLLSEDPFRTIDKDGVGALMKIAVKRGKQEKVNLKLGICGEHGGEPKSIDFCHQIGLNYVSCSPFRVPAARIASAQAVIRNKEDNL